MTYAIWALTIGVFLLLLSVTFLVTPTLVRLADYLEMEFKRARNRDAIIDRVYAPVPRHKDLKKRAETDE